MKKVRQEKSPKSQHKGISHSIYALGNSDWYRDVAAPFAEAMRETIPRHVGEIPPALRQRMTRGAQNHYLGYAIVGVTIFVAKKIGDDFYEIVLKPRIRKCFEWLDGKLKGANRKAQKVFVSHIWYKKHDVVVSVSIVGKDFAEIASQLDLLDVVHSNALNWIAKRGVSAPVHHYEIANGRVNAEPLLVEMIDSTTMPELPPPGKSSTQLKAFSKG
jgi:hypothetical protein